MSSIDDLNVNIEALLEIEKDDKFFERSAFMKQAWIEHRDSMMKGSFAARTPEEHAAARARLQEWMESPEGSAFLSEKAKALWADPEYRAKVSAGVTATLNQPEQKARASEHTKELWTRPGYRENHVAKIRANTDAKWSPFWPEYEKSLANPVYYGTRISLKGTALRDGHDVHQFQRWWKRFKSE